MKKGPEGEYLELPEIEESVPADALRGKWYGNPARVGVFLVEEFGAKRFSKDELEFAFVRKILDKEQRTPLKGEERIFSDAVKELLDRGVLGTARDGEEEYYHFKAGA